jgi:osmoprotectant transport system permease protein
MIAEFLDFVADRQSEIVRLSLEHLKLTGIAVSLAVGFGVPLGILLTRIRLMAMPVMNLINIIQTIPSLALLGFFIPLMGIGFKPAILALFLYSLLAIVKNTVTGIRQVDPDIIEAGKGMGMKNSQLLYLIEIPLASPVIFSGVRIAAVACIGIATLCAAIGAGGLGQLIFRGMSMVNNHMILAGALPAALMALVIDFLLHLAEKKLTPRQQK